jgi:hypothetical protein
MSVDAVGKDMHQSNVDSAAFFRRSWTLVSKAVSFRYKTGFRYSKSLLRASSLTFQLFSIRFSKAGSGQ